MDLLQGCGSCGMCPGPGGRVGPGHRRPQPQPVGPRRCPGRMGHGGGGQCGVGGGGRGAGGPPEQGQAHENGNSHRGRRGAFTAPRGRGGHEQSGLCDARERL